MEKTFAFSSSVSDESVKRSVCHGRNRINRENSLDVITCEDGDSAVQSHTQSRVRKESIPVEKKDKKNEEEEEEEEENAPNELIMEFLTCVMQKDFVNAKKLCKMGVRTPANNRWDSKEDA
uniref:Uncharacterized protein n=1 Tax=Capitella teleta TaxID=283909 RepID=X2A1J8_CAPTE